MAVKLMAKWPNLYYSTSAFSPKYYPKAIVNYANTRGADKIMYAGYFPHAAVGAHFRGVATRTVPRTRVAEISARECGARLFKLYDDAG